MSLETSFLNNSVNILYNIIQKGCKEQHDHNKIELQWPQISCSANTASLNHPLRIILDVSNRYKKQCFDGLISVLNNRTWT